LRFNQASALLKPPVALRTIIVEASVVAG